jgi:hypothetical protein
MSTGIIECVIRNVSNTGARCFARKQPLHARQGFQGVLSNSEGEDRIRYNLPKGEDAAATTGVAQMRKWPSDIAQGKGWWFRESQIESRGLINGYWQSPRPIEE